MIKKKNIINLFFAICFGSLAFVSCEADADALGLQFFDDNKAEGVDVAYDVIAFNKNNRDTIRTDAMRLQQATLGAFDEGHFGMQKSTYFTQARLSTYSPDFGTVAVVDSVVLEIKPFYHSDSLTTKPTDITYNGTSSTQELKSYPIKKYGKTKLAGATTFNIKVEEVKDFLNSTSKTVYSDKTVTTGVNLGDKTFDGVVRAVNIKDKSNSTVLLDREAAIRIPLDKSFFQAEIIDKQGNSSLNNAANFIRHFKGLKISVNETDGYLFNFDPNEVGLTIYYKSDATSTEKTYKFDMGASNVHFNTFKFTRSAEHIAIVSGINSTTGDAKLYIQGMGGMGAQVKIPQTAIDELISKYTQNKAGILVAKIRLYTDNSTWNGTFAKPTGFVVNQEGVTSLMEEMTFFPSMKYSTVSAYKLSENPAYYDIDITKTLKDIVEKGNANKDLIVNVGDYIVNTSGNLINTNYNSRSFSPNRVILVGSDLSNPNRAKLNITYTKK